jgi:hypothetical protein
MSCDKCGTAIPAGDEREHQGMMICEDCYMVALSPIKTCDPWAVHSAKNFEKYGGDQKQLTDIHGAILRELKSNGAMDPAALLEKIDKSMDLAELQREFSILRHMEKVRAEKQEDAILWRLW